jgi:tetratricopeptide (TPR) repeat protein
MRNPVGRTLVVSLAVFLGMAKGEDLVEEGNKAYREGRFEAAVDAYTRAVKRNPSAELYLNLGHGYVQLGKFAEAVDAYQIALKLAPETQDGHWLLGHALYGAERYDDAIQHFWKAAPARKEALLWIGQAYERLEDFVSAETSYRDAAARHPDFREVREALAVLYMRRERYEEAAQVYGALSRRFPADEKLRKRLAEAKAAQLVKTAAEAYREERFSRAAALYEEAAGVLPSAELLVSLGHCFLQTENYDRAVQSYRKALALEPNRKGVKICLGRALFAANKFEEAVGPLREALEESAGEDAALLLGQAYEQKGDLKSAEDVYRKAAGKELEKLRPAEALAVLLAKSERFGQAAEVYEALSRRFPENEGVRRRLSDVRAVRHASQGNEAFEKGEFEAAARCFEASLKERRSADILMNLGHACVSLQRYRDGVRAYRDALEVDPKRIEAYWPLAQALYQAGELEEAIGCFRQSLKESEREQAYLAIGKCFEVLESANSARSAYEEGVVRFPASCIMREALAALHSRSGRPELAAEIYSGLVKRRPGDVQLLKGLAQAHLSCGNADKALDALETARRLAPEDASVHQSLADLYLSRNMHREASEMYRLLLGLTSKPSAEDYFRLAHAYFQANEFVSAKEALNKAIELDKSHASSYLYLGHVALQEGKPEDAASAYKKALEADPDSEAVHLALAGLLLQREDYAQAAHHCRQALKKQATAATYRNAIIALVRSGNKSEARELLKEANQRHPGHKELADIVKLFGDKDLD